MSTAIKPRLKHLLAACLSALLLSACVKDGQIRLDADTLRAAVDTVSTMARSDVTPQQEAKIGEESASMLLGAAPLVHDATMERYVNLLGGWLARQTARPDINWRFGIINSPNVNAFAAPDGYIFITKGLLRQLNNEAELAGVLGHEMGHVIRRHYILAMKKKDTANAFGNLASTAAKGYGVKGAEQVATPLFSLAQNIYSSGLDKDDEYEADRLGVIYATRSGYDPYGLPRVLTMYAGHAGASGFELLFSTHPAPEARLAELDRAMDGKLDPFESTGVSDSAEFQRIVSLARAYPDNAKTRN